MYIDEKPGRLYYLPIYMYQINQKSRLKYRTFFSFQSLTLNAHPINTIYDLQARSLEFNAYFTTITIEKQSKAHSSS